MLSINYFYAYFLVVRFKKAWRLLLLTELQKTIRYVNKMRIEQYGKPAEQYSDWD
jgi:hypothetical protein